MVKGDKTRKRRRKKVEDAENKKRKKRKRKRRWSTTKTKKKETRKRQQKRKKGKRGRRSELSLKAPEENGSYIVFAIVQPAIRRFLEAEKNLPMSQSFQVLFLLPSAFKVVSF